MKEKIEKRPLNIPISIEIIKKLKKLREDTGAPVCFTIEKVLREYFDRDESGAEKSG